MQVSVGQFSTFVTQMINFEDPVSLYNRPSILTSGVVFCDDLARSKLKNNQSNI